MPQVYNSFKELHAKGQINLLTDDIRALLVMTNSTAWSENDGKVYLSDLTTLDEMNGANYARKVLTNKAITKDDGNDRAEFDADDLTFASLGAGARQVKGAVIFKHVTSGADSPLVAAIDLPSPVAADGTNFVIQWNAEGILQLA